MTHRFMKVNDLQPEEMKKTIPTYVVTKQIRIHDRQNILKAARNETLYTEKKGENDNRLLDRKNEILTTVK